MKDKNVTVYQTPDNELRPHEAAGSHSWNCRCGAHQSGISVQGLAEDLAEQHDQKQHGRR